MEYIDHGPCFCFVTREDGVITHANKTICSSLGYSREELIGQKQDFIFTLATRIFQQTHLYPLLKIKGAADEILISLQSRNKDHLSVLFNVERKAVNDVVVIIFIGIRINHRKQYEERLLHDKKMAELALLDNTALKEVKEELQKRVEQLDHHTNIVRKQTAELKQFNKVVTHDLQEPLRKLSMFANLLLTENSRRSTPEVINKMILAAEKIGSVVSGLQQYIWITETPLNLVELNLNDIILSTVEKLREESGVTIIIEKEALPSLKADKEQVQLLIYNLLSNVTRFRKPGKDAKAKLSGKILQLNIFRNTENKYKYADFIKFRLEDEGVGFDPVYNDQAFDLFKPLHDNSGPGIGLSLCKKIVENHEGTISINSAEGVGTTITFILPLN